MDNQKIAQELLAMAKELTAARVPQTIREWQIYDKPGAGEAARELGKATAIAAKQILRVLKKPSYGGYDEARVAKMIGGVYKKVLEPVMDRYQEFGATDTEPIYVGQQYLIDIVKAHYNIDGWTNLGDRM